jgi:hypothetical protein
MSSATSIDAPAQPLPPSAASAQPPPVSPPSPASTDTAATTAASAPPGANVSGSAPASTPTVLTKSPGELHHVFSNCWQHVCHLAVCMLGLMVMDVAVVTVSTRVRQSLSWTACYVGCAGEQHVLAVLQGHGLQDRFKRLNLVTQTVTNSTSARYPSSASASMTTSVYTCVCLLFDR